MSGHGAPGDDLTGLDAHGLGVAIVAATWHPTVMDGLLNAAVATCEELGAATRVVRVPGSFELPIVVQQCARSGYDAVVALGVIVRGGTPHFEYVCAGTTDGLIRVSLETGVPVGFGVLTCDTELQAIDRAGLPGSHESKGREATVAALRTALTLRELGAGKRSRS